MSMLSQQHTRAMKKDEMNNPWEQDPDDEVNPPPKSAIGRRLRWLLIIVAVIILGYWLSDLYPGTFGDGDGDKIGRFFYLTALLALVAAGFVSRRRISLNRATKFAGLWFAIVAVLALGYAFRSELKMAGGRVFGELMPGYNIANAPQIVEITASNNGHYMIDSLVNGRPLRFMVDTGASLVVLSPSDAERLGYELSELNFDRSMRTANGIVQGASIRIERISIGSIEMEDVPAIVNGTSLPHSLLGMSYLERLTSFGIRDGRLTLRGTAN